MIKETLEQFINQIKLDGLYRIRERCEELPYNFSSNDYLSLRRETSIQNAYREGFRFFPVGSAGSMVVSGYHSAHASLEKAFAKALDVDECLIFTSGFAANLSIASFLGRLKLHALIDKEVHASIYDGLKLADVSYTRYHHQNLTDLTEKRTKIKGECIVLTESIFSMSGQKTPLKAIAALCPGQLIVDEAHAFGVSGKEGLGEVVASDLSQHEVPLRVIPLGKAFAASGAIIAGQHLWIEALLQCARSYIYSTALSPAYAYGLEYTLDVIRQADDRRQTLNDLILYFRKKTTTSKWSWSNSSTQIQQLKLGCPYRAIHTANRLRDKHIFCLPMRPPTVRKPDSGLRVVLNANHRPEQIDYLFDCLEAI
ncbi:aminotransferase class I/II-fold pyridoxal phosphate-dependent enzyme [Legionella impletisoli]|uniref:8-amino-7-oxononanoate synthase n=1 Tax=Legionella impletisoli TaxID=343510 RepID=A0A917N9V6_9GAMM|nr:aminotransferase class I/II-fold pyridoxal phosphate-dependent enzyme [Legionella impletisoli]GGI81389.1 8-amino-7-oxononanoate synthase [Legionella impletisoli]